MTLGQKRQYFFSARRKKVRGALHTLPTHVTFSSLILSCFVVCPIGRPIYTNTTKMSKPFDPEKAENLEDVRSTLRLENWRKADR